MSVLKSNVFTLLAAALAAILILGACNPEAVDPDPPTLNFATQTNAFCVTDNLGNSQNPQASLTAAYVTSMQSVFVAYSSFLLVPGNAVNAGANTWTWGDGAGNSIRYVWSESNGQNCVTVSLNGPQVTNGVYYEVCEGKDGNGGFLKVYDPDNGGALTLEVTWTKTGENSGMMEWVDYSSNDRQVATWEADCSGTFKIYEDSTLTYESSWNADGSGSYKEYDSMGNLTDQGTWG